MIRLNQGAVNASLTPTLQVRGVYIVHQPCEVHDSERMLEPLVGRTGKDQEGRCELVDVPQPLKRARVHHPSLIAV